MKDNVLLYGTDDYGKVQEMHEDMSYKHTYKSKKHIKNRLVDEYEVDVINEELNDIYEDSDEDVYSLGDNLLEEYIDNIMIFTGEDDE